MLRNLRKMLVGSSASPAASEAPTDPDAAHARAAQQESPLLHPDILLQLFSSMSPEKAVALASVCRAWRDAACTEPLLWKGLVDDSLLEAMSSHQPTDADPAEPSTSEAPMQQPSSALGLSIPHLYLALYARNYLANPDFRLSENTGNAWTFDGGQAPAWEQTTQGCEEVTWTAMPYPSPKASTTQAQLARWYAQLWAPKEHLSGGPKPACLATSYTWSQIVQVVDFESELQNRGFTRDQAHKVLDSGLSLALSLRMGARFDCGGQFSVALVLMEESPRDVNRLMQGFVAKPCRHHFYSDKLRTTEPGKWHRFAHVVDQVPAGFRYGVLLIRAKDTQFWAGFYGTKISCAELHFIQKGRKDDFCGEDGVEGWKDRMRAAGVEPSIVENDHF